ncbi:TYS1 [Hepatospora eriocheir]|uniref:thymidylate synthase n=1 Tax=Hepatospora eriocheir TaxID=1081669 RepID=A0A1X0QIV5_9MICR|nr:TYS1 [Hepatospora eriocheir]
MLKYIYLFCSFIKSDSEEELYISLIKECIEKGNVSKDRTGVGIRSLFGRVLRFSLADNTIPLITVKRTNHAFVLRELLLFISGKTDNKILKAQKVPIWNKNTTKEFHDENNTDLEEDDMGAIYGWQWRHFGAVYETCHTDYTNQGFDQFKYILETIKEKPYSRRLVVTAWNPSQFTKMALPPCQVSFQFRIYDGKLSCSVNMRSVDLCVGLPFDIAHFAFLTNIVAKLTNTVPHELVMFLNDCHVYNNHIEIIKPVLLKEQYQFPKLRLKDKEYLSFESFKFEDFIIKDYKFNEYVKLEVN